MPRFSVIVPAYKVQAYLPECLESVLGQSFPDLELIAVDDCSPDACGALIDEFAARDARVRAVHLSRNVGLGRARNAGIEHAAGDYLIFLDGDDTLAPDALHAIAERLKETDGPDVLVYDYARTYWSGEVRRNQLAAELAEDGPAPFRLDERPGLLRLLMVVWNKAYRREFVEREQLAFPPGYYEDTPWTYPAMMSAGTIATLDRVCVHYRQRRHGSILGTSSRKHFDVFEQYDRVFAYLAAHPELERWRPLLFGRMVDHLATVFARRDRLPRAARAEFLRTARAHYRRHRVPVSVSGLRPRLRHALVRFGPYRTYRLLAVLARARRRAARPAGAVLRAARAAALRLHYRTQLRLPLRADRAVFSSHRGRGHGCNPGALESAFRAFAPHVRTTWIAHREHQHTIPAATGRLRPGTAGYWTALARSKYLVSNTGFDGALVKRRGQVLIQTQAGTPLKRMGLDVRDRPAAAGGTDFAELLRGVDTWDYCLSANRHSTLVWERAFPSAYETLEYGMPRTDVFQQATPADVGRLRASLGIPEDAVAVLYAPTYRDYRSGPHRSLDLERVLRRLGPRVRDPRPRPPPVRGAAAGRRPRRPGPRRVGPSERGVALPGLRRAGHRLLVPDVRLRRPGPADRRARRRLGRLRGGPRHLLRPARLPAGRGRAQRGRADRHLRDRTLAGLALGPAAGRVPRAVLPVRRRAGRRTGGAAGGARGDGRAAVVPAARRAPPGALGRGGGTARQGPAGAAGSGGAAGRRPGAGGCRPADRAALSRSPRALRPVAAHAHPAHHVAAERATRAVRPPSGAPERKNSMPRFSVIVPAFNVAGRLSDALDSVLGQPFADVELIPVVDGPDSPAAAVVAGHAARDSRVVPVSSPPEDGLSGARNAGLAAATGEYVLFLDGDDELAPGALGALDAGLPAGADVVRFGHQRLHWWEGEAGTPPLDTAPEALGTQVPAWSAAYRRAFLVEHGLAFPEGPFTDVGWGGLVTLAAGRGAVVPTVCVRHRQRRQGSRLNAPGEHHLALLDQVERVLDRIAAQPVPAERSRALFGRLFALVLKTAAHPTRVPARSRRAFFRRAGRLHRRHRPAGFRLPGGSLGMQHRLLAAGAYTAFRALRLANRAAAGLARRVPRPRLSRTRLHYALQLRRPLDENLAVYCAYWGRGYACNPAAIHAKARELAPHIRSVFLVEPDAVDSVPRDVEHAVIGSRRSWEVLARAKYLINNANFADAVVKRPGSVHLQTQHGTPLKKMGVDQSTYPVVAAATGSFTRLLARVDRWDYNLSSNHHSTQMWERAFPGGYEALEYGYPRNDVYCTAGAEDVARVRERLGVPEGRTALLYAPTHRDHSTGLRVPPGPGGVLRGGRRAVRGAAARPLLLRPGRRARLGADHRRDRAPLLRGRLPGRRRADHGLLVDHVRLRQPGPPGRRVRGRLGGVPGDAGRLLRRDAGAARPGRAHPAGAGRALRRRLLRGRGGDGPAGPVPRAVLPVRRRQGGRAGRPPGAARRTARGDPARPAARRPPSGSRRVHPRKELTCPASASSSPSSRCRAFCASASTRSWSSRTRTWR